jgi:CarboxypepD_reg-like domain
LLKIFILNFIFQLPCFQTITEKGEPVSFTTVKKKNKSEGLITDENGYFCYENLKKGDTLQFSAIGFKSIEKSFVELEQSTNIILTENIQELEQIIVKKQKFKISKVGAYRKLNLISFGYGSNSLLAVAEFVENDKNITFGTIKSLKVAIESRETNYKLRFRFYENSNNNLPDDKDLLDQNIIVDTGLNSKIVEIDLERYQIPFQKDGIWVSIESFGKYNENNIFEPNKMGKFGSVTYKESNPKIVKSIESLAPIILFRKSNSKFKPYHKTWQNKYIIIFSKPHNKSSLEMMLDLEILH